MCSSRRLTVRTGTTESSKGLLSRRRLRQRPGVIRRLRRRGRAQGSACGARQAGVSTGIWAESDCPSAGLQCPPIRRRSRGERTEWDDPYSAVVLAGVLGDGGHDLVGCVAARFAWMTWEKRTSRRAQGGRVKIGEAHAPGTVAKQPGDGRVQTRCAGWAGELGKRQRPGAARSGAGENRKSARPRETVAKQSGMGGCKRAAQGGRVNLGKGSVPALPGAGRVK